jgi:hypothetical protein
VRPSMNIIELKDVKMPNQKFYDIRSWIGHVCMGFIIEGIICEVRFYHLSSINVFVTKSKG